MQINQETFADGEGSKPFITLGQLICQSISIPTLATAIEKEGIHTYDRFGRFVKACDTNRSYILDLLADQYQYETNFGTYVKSNGTPLSPLERFKEPQQNTEEAEDWDNPFDQFGWSADAQPDFNNIRQSQIEAEPKRVGKVRRKAPDAFVAALVRLLVAIAKRDPNINIDEMPGIKSDLLSVASKLDDKLDFAESTFDSYIEGLCKFKRGSRTSNYYKDLFPEYVK